MRVRDARLRDLGAGRQVQPEHRRAQRQQHRHGQGRSRGHEQGDGASSVADPGFLSRILIFVHPGSRIPDPKTTTKERG